MRATTATVIDSSAALMSVTSQARSGPPAIEHTQERGSGSESEEELAVTGTSRQPDA